MTDSYGFKLLDHAHIVALLVQRIPGAWHTLSQLTCQTRDISHSDFLSKVAPSRQELKNFLFERTYVLLKRFQSTWKRQGPIQMT